MNLLYSNDDNSSTDMKNIQLTTREELTSHRYNQKGRNKKLTFYSVFKIDCHKSAWLLEHNQHKSPPPPVPKTLENFRLCPFCHLNEVGHQLHFLFNCNLYDSLRSNFYSDIRIGHPLFKNFNDNEKNPLHIWQCRSSYLQTFSCLHAVVYGM